MTNPFGTEEMAAGYATSRPPIHQLILKRVQSPVQALAQRALDIGCGAGVSTKALEGFATQCIGMEPAEAMLQWTDTVAPEAEFVVGSAEAIPLAANSIDLITAAGSLNYVSLDSFFGEAIRVLIPQGVLVVYDFSAGKSFRNSLSLEQWFSTFQQRYPSPPNEARSLNPEILSQIDSRFQVRSHEYIEVGIRLSPQFYLDYVLTETNVAFAVRNGVPYQEIRSWCEDTLGPLWNGREMEVLFHGYFACMTPTIQLA